MKKVYSTILMLTITIGVLNLCSCGGSNDDEDIYAIRERTVIGKWKFKQYYYEGISSPIYNRWCDINGNMFLTLNKDYSCKVEGTGTYISDPDYPNMVGEVSFNKDYFRWNSGSTSAYGADLYIGFYYMYVDKEQWRPYNLKFISDEEIVIWPETGSGKFMLQKVN